jgi:hypothetical protein
MIAQPGLFNNELALAPRYLVLSYQAYYQMPESCTIPSPHPTSNQAEHRVMLDCSGDVGPRVPLSFSGSRNASKTTIRFSTKVYTERFTCAEDLQKLAARMSHHGRCPTHIPCTNDNPKVSVANGWSYQQHGASYSTSIIVWLKVYRAVCASNCPYVGGHRALCT